MSFRALDWAMNTTAQVTAHEKLVLIILAHCHNDETDACYPGIEYLARRSHLSRATVQRVISRLEEVGLVIRRVGGGRRSNQYVLFGVQKARLAPEQTNDGYAHQPHDEAGAASSYATPRLGEQPHDEAGAASSYEAGAASSYEAGTGIDREWTRPRGVSPVDIDPDAPVDTRIPEPDRQRGLARIAELRAQLEARSMEITHALKAEVIEQPPMLRVVH